MEIFRGIVGSQAFGLATETSDIDYRSVYIQSNEDILSNRYIPQQDYTKDDVGYEIRRFLELAEKGNPNILELLYLPEHCIIRKTPEWDLLLSYKKYFLTKECYKTFTSYAKSQLNKSQAVNKKFNWEKSRTERKDVLDINLNQCVRYQVPEHVDFYKTVREAFSVLIDKTSGKGTWRYNPWVFVYEFELID